MVAFVRRSIAAILLCQVAISRNMQKIQEVAHEPQLVVVGRMTLRMPKK